MKLSDIERARTLVEKRSAAASLLETARDGNHIHIDLSDGDGDYVTVVDYGTAAHGVIMGLIEQRLASIEAELVALGVEIDLPAIEPAEPDDDAANEAMPEPEFA